MTDYVYILINQGPDYSDPPGPPRSVHETLEGAITVFADGKHIDKWIETRDGYWVGPDGYGRIIRFEVWK